MIISWFEYFSVVFLDLVRGHETIHGPAGKTFFLCIVFTFQLGPKLLKVKFGVVPAMSCFNSWLVVFLGKLDLEIDFQHKLHFCDFSYGFVVCIK